MQKLLVIRKFYRDNEAEILELGRQTTQKFVFGAYPIDWIKFFTPIENDAWISIRCKGIAMYPQYPVLNYFVDFGNPTLKIAIEVDGKAYHSKEKDTVRDRQLAESGWIVYRISGSEMHRTDFVTWGEVSDPGDADDRDKIIDWLSRSGDGVIECIKNIHFERCDDDDPFMGVMRESLHNHRLVS